MNLDIFIIDNLVKFAGYIESQKDTFSDANAKSQEVSKMLEKIKLIESKLTMIFFMVRAKLLAKNSLIFECVLQQKVTTIIAFVACIAVFLVFGFALFIFPIAEKMKNEILMTIRLLNMIPPNIVAGTASIRVFLSKISVK